MTTLIIHPKDNSTQFLEIIYKDIQDKTVVTGGVTPQELKELIASHDRIMMMGHGSPKGLFSVGAFNWQDGWKGYCIDKQFVPLLKTKKNSVYIWCNADQFVNKHELTGFYSGMFISEVGEARYCGLSRKVDQGVVDESNFEFVTLMSQHIDDEDMSAQVITKYWKFAQDNEVAGYNAHRLYKRG